MKKKVHEQCCSVMLLDKQTHNLLTSCNLGILQHNAI